MNAGFNNRKTILTLLPGSKFKSINQLVNYFQSKYPKKYFYKPVGTEIEVTNLCNLRCQGCPILMDKYSKPDILSEDQIVNVLRESSKLGIFAYSLTGGEVSLKFEIAKKIISSNHGLDIYKYNTNGSFFKTISDTTKYLTELKDAGFSKKNNYIKSAFVVSIGQQNQAGVPLENAVNVTSQFYDVFDPKKTIFSLNITDKNMLLAKKIYKDFIKLYAKKTNKGFRETLFQVRFFSLNNIDTLKRLNMPLGASATIPELLEDYKNNYLSQGCFNIEAKNRSSDRLAETLIPRCVLRPNGDLYLCPGYSYVHFAGNVLKKPFNKIISNVNTNIIFKTIFTKNLTGLYKLASKKKPKLKKLILKKAYDPCDLCKILTYSLTNNEISY